MPAAIAASVEPEPPWPTIAAASGITCACGTQRSTWTFAGTGPSVGGIDLGAERHQHADVERARARRAASR